jgi:hypothetical protein
MCLWKGLLTLYLERHLHMEQLQQQQKQQRKHHHHHNYYHLWDKEWTIYWRGATVEAVEMGLPRICQKMAKMGGT